MYVVWKQLFSQFFLNTNGNNVWKGNTCMQKLFGQKFVSFIVGLLEVSRYCENTKKA